MEWLFPREIHFQIDGRNHTRVTRVAKLDELAKAIGAIEEDIERLVQGAPALIFGHSDIEQLCQKKSALVELQKRAGRSGCPGSTTVIEALFPDIPVKKKTASEKAEIEQWLAIRKEAALKIDPETAEVDRTYVLDEDPYGVLDEWELPEEFHQIGVRILRVLLEATSGFISMICPTLSEKSFGRRIVRGLLSPRASRGCPRTMAGAPRGRPARRSRTIACPFKVPAVCAGKARRQKRLARQGQAQAYGVCDGRSNQS